MSVVLPRRGLRPLIACAVIIALLCQAVVRGQENADPDTSGNSAFVAPQFSVQPVSESGQRWFDLTIGAGESVDLLAQVSNFGDIPVRLRTFAANGINPPNGGFGAATEEESTEGVARWLHHRPADFELEPGEKRVLQFNVTVPADTPPGDYVAAIVVRTAESWDIPGTETFRQIIQSVVSVEMTVPGEMTAGFELGAPTVSANGLNWSLTVPITNTGTARVRPSGELSLTNLEGIPISNMPVEMGSVYGGNTTTLNVNFPQHIPPGDYLVSLELIDEATDTTSSLTDAQVTFAGTQEISIFTVENATVTVFGSPVQYAEVMAIISNNGQAIPNANVTLHVQRDGQDVESYPLARNQSFPQGTTDFSQRYVPIDGWLMGTYKFQLVVSAVEGGSETRLAVIDVDETIVVPAP